MTALLFILVSFSASVAGSICGLGGGVIIKPVLDAFGLYSVAAVSFMSGCVVLAMTAYSVTKATRSGESLVEKGVSTCLGVGAVQACVLFAVTLATALYTMNKGRISTRRFHGPAICLTIGWLLGAVSSFLGIGGGPINLLVLSFFFSMETKAAAQNSLYIILFSQTASLLLTLLTGTVPEFPVSLFMMMVCSGILGAAVGRRINRRLDSSAVDKLFLGLLIVIMFVCCYNFYRYI